MKLYPKTYFFHYIEIQILKLTFKDIYTDMYYK